MGAEKPSDQIELPITTTKWQSVLLDLNVLPQKATVTCYLKLPTADDIKLHGSQSSATVESICNPALSICTSTLRSTILFVNGTKEAGLWVVRGGLPLQT